MLHSDSAGVRGEPDLPARATVPAHSSVLVARVHPTQAAGLGLRLETVPGSVHARPRDYEYLFPLPAGEPRPEQAWGGRHNPAAAEERKSLVKGKGVAGRVDHGGRRTLHTTKSNTNHNT